MNIYHFCKCLACNPDFQSCRAMLVPKCIKCTCSLNLSALKCRAMLMRSCTRLMARWAQSSRRLAVAAQRLAVALQRLAKLTRNQHAVHLRKATCAGLLPLLPHPPPCYQSLLPSSRLRLGEAACNDYTSSGCYCSLSRCAVYGVLTCNTVKTLTIQSTCCPC